MCGHCGGECRLSEADRYGATFFPNNPEGQRAFIARIHHWLGEPWLTGVRAYQTAKAALGAPAPTFPCSSCGKFAFPDPTVCFGCRR